MKHKSGGSDPSSGQDARVVRTDGALRTALLALLERHPFEHITIRQIAAEAGVHYATFFRHHSTKEALLDHVAADQIRHLVSLTLPVMDREDRQAAFATLCTYIDEHRKLWTTLLTGGAAKTMREEYLKISETVAMERAPKDLWLPVGLAVVCTVRLIIETLVWWLSQPPEAFPIQEVARILDRLVQVDRAV